MDSGSRRGRLDAIEHGQQLGAELVVIDLDRMAQGLVEAPLHVARISRSMRATMSAGRSSRPAICSAAMRA